MKALVEAFSVILKTDESFVALENYVMLDTKSWAPVWRKRRVAAWSHSSSTNFPLNFTKYFTEDVPPSIQIIINQELNMDQNLPSTLWGEDKIEWFNSDFMRSESSLSCQKFVHRLVFITLI